MKILLLSLILAATATVPLHATMKMPNIFSDHMVLQQAKPVPVWGKGNPGAEVVVTFGKQTKKTTVAPDATWQVTLDPLAASFEPRVLSATSGDVSLVFNDVLVGEVWLCSGQSNMAWSVQQSNDADIEKLAADHPAIRLLHITQVTSQEPLFSNPATWEVCSPETIESFSAVGYYFGRDLRQVLDVPVGLVDSNWGGTPAIAWTRQQALDNHPLLTAMAERWERNLKKYPEDYDAWLLKMHDWRTESGKEPYREDRPSDAWVTGYARLNANTSEWTTETVDATSDRVFRHLEGAVWFRKTVDLPEALQGKELTLNLGRIDDFDTTWVNGEHVGETRTPSEAPWRVERHYTIPAALTGGDSLTIAVRVFDRFGIGGFRDPEALAIKGPDGETVSLDGDWLVKGEFVERKQFNVWQLRRLGAPNEPRGPDNPHRPANLANGMIAPVAPYAMQGAIWYQGESDAGWEPYRYGERLGVMIEDWRSWWSDPDLAFGIVQLASFQAFSKDPIDTGWSQLRESQRLLADTLPLTGLAVTTDIGEANDIHPANKQTVGRRLARWALADIYAKINLRGGPELIDATFVDSKVTLTFGQIGDGLMIIDGMTLDGFTLAGTDGTFHHATAKIIGKDTVVVSAEAVAEPVHVRYAWQTNPEDANLGNVQRLPASPFEAKAKE